MANKSDTTAQESMLSLGLFFPGYDQMPEHFKPAAIMATRMEAEMMRLWARRAQAWIELPSKVMACKGPGDMAKLQSEFWTTLGEHYAECAGCAMSAGSEPAVHRDERTAEAAPDVAEQTPQRRKAA
ncbi:MAG: hypothetical protein VX871_03975 [Pseudomonadota bacterium]|nr:hypothetical protein [Pseudomonadota bacterium]